MEKSKMVELAICCSNELEAKLFLKRYIEKYFNDGSISFSNFERLCSEVCNYWRMIGIGWGDYLQFTDYGYTWEREMGFDQFQGKALFKAIRYKFD